MLARTMNKRHRILRGIILAGVIVLCFLIITAAFAHHRIMGALARRGRIGALLQIARSEVLPRSVRIEAISYLIQLDDGRFENDVDVSLKNEDVDRWVRTFHDDIPSVGLDGLYPARVNGRLNPKLLSIVKDHEAANIRRGMAYMQLSEVGDLSEVDKIALRELWRSIQSDPLKLTIRRMVDSSTTIGGRLNLERPQKD